MSDYQKYRARLATLWFGGSGLIFFFVIVQSMMNHYHGENQAVWAWLSPNIMPILTLVLGITVFTKEDRSADTDETHRLFRITMGASIFYLAMLAAPIIFGGMIKNRTEIEVLRDSSLWLGLLQGITTTLLGVFFTRDKSAGAAALEKKEAG